MSTSASRSLKGQDAKITTVKWSIRSFFFPTSSGGAFYKPSSVVNQIAFIENSEEQFKVKNTK